MVALHSSSSSFLLHSSSPLRDRSPRDFVVQVARVCQMNAASTSSLELVAKFFAYFASFDWTSAVVSLNPAAEGAFQREQRVSMMTNYDVIIRLTIRLLKDLMAILLPIRPFRNTARNLTPSTRDVIVTELRAAAQIVCATPTPITTLPEVTSSLLPSSSRLVFLLHLLFCELVF